MLLDQRRVHLKQPWDAGGGRVLHAGEAPERVALVHDVVRPRTIEQGGELVVQHSGRDCVAGRVAVAHRGQLVNPQRLESGRRRLIHAGGKHVYPRAVPLQSAEHLLHVD